MGTDSFCSFNRRRFSRLFLLLTLLLRKITVLLGLYAVGEERSCLKGLKVLSMGVIGAGDTDDNVVIVEDMGEVDEMLVDLGGDAFSEF